MSRQTQRTPSNPSSMIPQVVESHFTLLIQNFTAANYKKKSQLNSKDVSLFFCLVEFKVFSRLRFGHVFASAAKFDILRLVFGKIKERLGEEKKTQHGRLPSNHGPTPWEVSAAPVQLRQAGCCLSADAGCVSVAVFSTSMTFSWFKQKVKYQ